MRLRPILLLLAIVVLPVVLMTWAAQRLAAREAEAVRQRFRQVMEGRLQDANAGIEAHFDRLGSDLRRLTAIDVFRVDVLRDVVRNEPALLQLTSPGILEAASAREMSGSLMPIRCG